MQFSQPSAARQLNRLRTLNLVAKERELSRADIARLLGLSKVSTSEIVDQLIKENLLTEAGIRPTDKGRPPINITLNKDAAMVLAIDIGSRNISVGIVNLGGEIRRFERLPSPVKPSAEELAALIIQLSQKFLARMKDPDLIKGLAISMAAEIEGATGTILNHPQWQYKDVPLSFALKRHLRFPILLENSVKSLIQGEFWFANLDAQTNYLYLNWSDHLETVFLSKGKMFPSVSLFDHMPTSGSKRCYCGLYGCLHTTASVKVLTEGTTLKNLLSQDHSPSLSHAAILMGQALVPAALALRPQKIIIGGPMSILPERYYTELKQAFWQQATPLLTTEIERSSLGEQAGLLGTAAIALDEFVFKRSVLEQLKGQRLA
ncbi:MAG: ROK family transcriptional regulator [Sphaerochaetaceae bacterium]